MIIVSPSFRWFWGPPTQNHRVPCYRCWLVAYPAATDSPVLFSFSLFSSCFSIRLTESCCWRVVRHELHIAAEKYICVRVCMYLCNIYICVCMCVFPFFGSKNGCPELTRWMIQLKQSLTGQASSTAAPRPRLLWPEKQPILTSHSMTMLQYITS